MDAVPWWVVVYLIVAPLLTGLVAGIGVDAWLSMRDLRRAEVTPPSIWRRWRRRGRGR